MGRPESFAAFIKLVYGTTSIDNAYLFVFDYTDAIAFHNS